MAGMCLLYWTLADNFEVSFSTWLQYIITYTRVRAERGEGGKKAEVLLV